MSDQNNITIGEHDLVLISDSGRIYVVPMDATPGAGHEPRGDVLPLGATPIAQLPMALRDLGVTVGNLPRQVMAGGCTCYLLNLQSLSGQRPGGPLDLAAVSLTGDDTP